MKINQTFRYGVACLFELSRHPEEYIESTVIADRQNIPSAYAQKILQCLIHGGLVYSQKGCGYRLARPLETITALDVLETLANSKDCASEFRPRSSELERRMEKALSAISLGCMA